MLRRVEACEGALAKVGLAARAELLQQAHDASQPRGVAAGELVDDLAQHKDLQNEHECGALVEAAATRQRRKEGGAVPPAEFWQSLRRLRVRRRAPLSSDEAYWERCCMAREEWQPCRVADYGRSWKRLYFERNLTDFLEAFDPDQQDTEELTRTLAVSKDYVFSLRIKQFLSHLDMEMARALVSSQQ